MFQKSVSRLLQFVYKSLFILFIFSMPLHGQYVTNGDAVQQSDDCFRLTRERSNELGSVFNLNSISLLKDFYIDATLNFGDRNNSGADGMAFVFTTSPNVLGFSGEGMGYGGISPSIVVEMDGYQNGGRADPRRDHISLMRNGNPSHNSPDNLDGPIEVDNFEDGEDHCFSLSWNAQRFELIASLDGTEVFYSGNIILQIFGGNSDVFWGFTSSTGGSVNEHRVCINASTSTFKNMADLTVCLGDTVVLQPDPNGVSYQWTPHATLSDPSVENPEVVPTDTTKYSVLVEFPCGTKFRDTIEVFTVSAAINLDAVAPLCERADPVQLTFSPPGGTFSAPVSPTGVFDPSLTGSGSQTVVYTIDLGVCDLKTTTIIQVNPTPVLTVDSIPNLCANDTAYQLIFSPSGGKWTGAADASGIIRPDDLGIDTFQTLYSYTDLEGCFDSLEVEFPVYPLPPTQISAIASLCVNHDSITLAASPVGGTWTGVDSTAGFNPPTFGIGDFEVTYQFIDTIGCAASDTLDIRVNPLPVVAIDPVREFCDNETIFTLSANPAGGVWSGFADSMGNIAPLLFFPGDYEAFYEFTDTVGCINTDSVIVKINPIPFPEIDSVGSFCESAAAVQLTANLSNGTWTGAGTTGIFNPQTANTGPNLIQYEVTNVFGCTNSDDLNINILPNPTINLTSGIDFCASDTMSVLAATPSSGMWSGTPNMNGEILPSTLGSGMFPAEYQYTDSEGCSDTLAFDITIAPSTPIDFLNIGPFCQNIDNQLVMANPSGGTFSNSATMTGEVSPQNLPVGLNDIRYEFTDSRGCETDTVFQVEILDIPTVEIVSMDTICPNAVQMQFSGTPAGGDWTGDVDVNGVFDPQVLGPGDYLISYEFEDANNCKVSDDTTFMIRAFADLNFSGTGPFCLENTTQNIGVNLTGGTWSGDVNLDGSFIPTDLGAGNFEAIYSFTDFAGCETVETVDFEILAPVQIAFGDSAFCENESSVMLSANPPAGVWSGQNVAPDGSFEPSDFAPGNYNLTYTFTQAGAGCVFTEPFELIINPKPSVDFAGDTVLCETLDPQTFTGIPANGIWSGPIDNDGIVIPRDLGVGMYQIGYTVFSPERCRNTINKTLEITEPPSISGFVGDTICLDGDPGQLTIFAEGVGPFDVLVVSGTDTETLIGINSGHQFSVNPTQTTTYQITEITDTRCADDVRSVASVLVNVTPEATLVSGLEVCNSGRSGETTFLTFDSLIISGDVTGTWIDLENSQAIGAFPTLDFKGVTPGQYRFQYTTGSAESPCTNPMYEVVLTVRDCNCPSVTTLPAGPFCSDDALLNLPDITLTNEPGIWAITGAPIGFTASLSGNAIFDATGSLSGDYELTYTINKAPISECPDSSVQVIQVFDPPIAEVVSTFQICNSDEVGDDTSVDFSALLLSGDMTGDWTDVDDSGATGNFPILDFNGGRAGQYRFRYETTTAQAPCGNFVGEVLLTVNDCRCQASMIKPIDAYCSDDVRLDLASITETTEPGTWTLTDSPAGSIGGLSGTIFDATGSTAGDYEFTFTLDDPTRPGCPQSTSHILKVSEFVTAGSFSNDLEICNFGDDIDLNDLLTGESSGGVWRDISAISAGSFFNNGLLIGQDLPEGTYLFEYFTETESPCLNDSARIEIKIENPVNAGQKISDYIGCGGLDSTVLLFDFIEKYDLGGMWEDISASPISVFDPSGNLNLEDFSTGNFRFQYIIPTSGICSADSITVNFQINPTPVADAGEPVSLSCTSRTTLLGENSSSGFDITYSWVGDVDDPTAKTNEINRPGTYYLTVTDTSSGCSDTDSVEISRDGTLPFLSVEADSITCFGDNDGKITVVDVEGGTPPFLYSLNDEPFNSQSSYSDLSPGNYTIELEDAQGCTDKLSFNLTEPDELSVDLIADFGNVPGLINQGDSILLTAQTTGSFDSIFWSLGSDSFFCDSSLICLSQNVAPQTLTNYGVLVENINGCSDFSELQIRVKKVRRAFVPEAFSPNGDGINDVLTVFGGKNAVMVNSLKIFDRWGGKLFESKDFLPGDPAGGWDGTINGKSLNSGVFAYLVEISFLDGTIEVSSGSVNIVK